LYNSVVSRWLEMMRELLAEPSYNFEVSSEDVPEKSGVYAIYDKRVKAVIYVGRTKNLRRRLLGDHKRGNIRGSQFRKASQQNFALKSESEITAYILENCSFQFVVIEEFDEMVRLEHFTTAILAPILNIKLKQ
jgi:excinuclease UvrABC nuclease subunit